MGERGEEGAWICCSASSAHKPPDFPDSYRAVPQINPSQMRVGFRHPCGYGQVTRWGISMYWETPMFGDVTALEGLHEHTCSRHAAWDPHSGCRPISGINPAKRKNEKDLDLKCEEALGEVGHVGHFVFRGDAHVQNPACGSSSVILPQHHFLLSISHFSPSSLIFSFSSKRQ